MANKGSVAVTATVSAAFGPGEKMDIIIQNTGNFDAFISWETAEADKGLRLAPDESVSTHQLTEKWGNSMANGLTAICASGQTTTLLWHA